MKELFVSLIFLFATLFNFAQTKKKVVAKDGSGNYTTVQQALDAVPINNKKPITIFINCYIEGTTDFIFGSSTVWFERCHIHSKKNSHITAASTPQQNQFGYVFNDCILTGDTSLRGVSLGRPWRQYANVTYIYSYIGPHILPEGWRNWNNTENYKTTKYSEYENYGPRRSTC